ncbi:uncharacterized protein MYCFIDRAFT_142999 [Pseudocercospora fijiensis CIRAD86]|uniref:Prolyl 4-hydroxylase alpha subunit domain-containing protein n=1 Tax=Pseudocercospora fijiensis (strain CIRAD86) TaxID=383855 RepID=M2YP09_PSEFD|nr:uncharacterized protein MYCFIDRAFT_142999 [Pseudocercospora fijiensis CIRAD86]EME79490.1 hypothetical protein MYCFIDRAFT_142999 [Pseudocercospora fijiensis CIRAD86]
MSYDPLIAHLEDLVSYEERQYLIKLARPLLHKSQVSLANGTQTDSPGRTSSTAFLPSSDPVVMHVLERAAEFQGYIDLDQMDMQVTAYRPGQEYKAHFDWFPRPNANVRNRFSTFFAILEADCTNCGTQFPSIQLDTETLDSRWCKSINCTAESLTTLNFPGHALFWRNLDPWGAPRQDVLHAGLPAFNGTKIGLNIWTEIEVDPDLYPSQEEAEEAEAEYDEEEWKNWDQGDDQGSEEELLDSAI